MISAASVKERLKNLSVASGKTLQELLIAYALERTIYRIAISNYKEHFILKGGIFLYALEDGNFSRATSDIDLLAQNISNQNSAIKSAFIDIFSIETDDPLTYNLQTLTIKNITELKKYHGLNISIISYLDKTRIPISIDIGFGDVIHPDKILIDFPVLLPNSNIPKIYAYSIYSCIAEKFEAIVSLGYGNSRFKDFYDIYIYLSKFDFDGQTLLEAVKETFSYRNTLLNDIVAFEDDFANEPTRKSRWNNFTKKKKISIQISLTEILIEIKSFLLPIINVINTDNLQYNQTWSHNSKSWLPKPITPTTHNTNKT